MVDARRARTQIKPDKLLDVDSLQQMPLDLLVLFLHLPCTCTYLPAPALADWAGRRGGHGLPKHARRFASATVEFQARVRSTDDVQTWTFTSNSLFLLAYILTYVSEKRHTNQLPLPIPSLKHFEAVN